MKKLPKLKAAIIGLWGHEIYAKQLAEHPSLQLVCVSGFAEASAEMINHLKLWAENYKVPFYQDYPAMLKELHPGVCIVMVPPKLNSRIVRDMLCNGVHTVSEKPVSGNSEDTRLLAKTLKEVDVRYTACFPLPKFSKPFADAYHYIREGHLGDILSANFTYLASRGPLYITKEPHYRDPDVSPPSVSGGEAAMFSGYGIIALEWFVGERIKSVYAKAGSYFYPPYREKYIDDMAHFVIKFENGVVGSILTGRTPSPSAPCLVSFDITGTTGNLTYDSRQAKDSIGIPRYSLIDDFIKAIIEKKAPLISAEDVLSTVEVLSAAYRSNHLGKEVKVEGNRV